MVMGPKTATSSADETSTQPISPAGTEPCIRPRTTVARWVIGLTSTTACNHPGIVFGSTKMLLTNVSGNITIMLTPATEFGVRRIRLSIVHSHDRQNENTNSSTTESTTPTAPPSGRNPRTNPSAITIADPIE